MRFKNIKTVVLVIVVLACFTTSSNPTLADTTVTDLHKDAGTPAYCKETIHVFDLDKKTKIGTLKKGTVFRYIHKQDDYYRIKYKDGFAYVLTESLITGDELSQYALEHPDKFSKKITVLEDDTKLYDMNTQKAIATVAKGTMFLSDDETDYYYVVSFDDHEALISKESVEVSVYVKVKDLADDRLILEKIARNMEALRQRLGVQYTPTTDCTFAQRQLIQYAIKFVGNPYVWGGTSLTDGIDCSGFTQAVYYHFGIDLPRCSYEQAECGTEVSLSEIQPGDLLFYQRGERIGHVAMYIGNGKIVHAKGSKYGIVIDNVNYSTPKCVKRILNF